MPKLSVKIRGENDMIYGYARVSTKGQAKDGNSLESQIEILRENGAIAFPSCVLSTIISLSNSANEKNIFLISLLAGVLSIIPILSIFTFIPR